MRPRFAKLNDDRDDYDTVGSLHYGPYLLVGLTDSVALRADVAEIDSWLTLDAARSADAAHELSFTANTTSGQLKLLPLNRVVDQVYTAHFNVSESASRDGFELPELPPRSSASSAEAHLDRAALKFDDHHEATATAASRALRWPAAGVRRAEGALLPPPCPCSPASLCRSLSPQPPARPEVLAFSTAGWEYSNPTTVNKTEPFFFDHYPWDRVTTVAPFVGQSSGSDWGIDAYTPQLVCKAHQHNARVVGHIGHGAATWPAILSPSYRSTWVQQIVTWFIHTQGMDGIQVRYFLDLPCCPSR